jgi:predicted RNase H-like HicB family nuclease
MNERAYIVIYEHTDHNWAAYAPDVPGCLATGRTRAGVERKFREALAFHLEGLRLEGLPLPEPTTEAGLVTVSVMVSPKHWI